jgi:hypothetical protein
MVSAILLQAQKESHRNLPHFTGDFSYDVNEYIEKIESIEALTEEPDEVLHVLLKEKLSGQAERWFQDNKASLSKWSQLCSGLRDRFQQPWLNQTLFATLDNRKQDTHESANDYYDAVCRLCRRVDPKMSKQMILYFLQKGVRDEMKSNITRSMLTENDPTPETFLKFAKVEEHLERINQPTDSTISYLASPEQQYMMTSTVNPLPPTYPNLLPSSPIRRTTPAPFQMKINRSIQSPSFNHPRYESQQHQPNNNNDNNTYPHRRFNERSIPPLMQPQSVQSIPCPICGRANHHLLNCYHRKPSGCYKCGHNGHRINACPQVFF